MLKALAFNSTLKSSSASEASSMPIESRDILEFSSR